MFREIARKKQSIEKEQIIKILNNEKRGVLSVCGENGYPYGLPMNYWYNEENGKNSLWIGYLLNFLLHYNIIFVYINFSQIKIIVHSYYFFSYISNR